MDAYVPPALGRYSKALTGNTTAYISDAGINFSCTGTFTLTLDSPSNLGANWTCAVFNAGAGTITIDAQSAHIISSKGLTDHTDTLTSGRGHIITCNGTDFEVLSTNYDEVGSATWGNITGTLSTQTDLQNALDAKAATSTTITGTGMLSGGGSLASNRTLNLASAAASTILGNNAVGSAVPIAMTVAQTKALLAYTPDDIGALPAKLTVYNLTGDASPTAAATGWTYTNTGTSALVTVTLPTSVTTGVHMRFIVDDVDGFKIKCQAGHTITVGTTVSADAGYTTSTAIGSTIHIIYAASNKWVAISSTGTWTTA